MTSPEYSDREKWPEYWRAIRRASIIFVVLVVAVLVAQPLETAADRHPWRIALLVLIGLGVSIAVERISDWIAGRWERWLQRR